MPAPKSCGAFPRLLHRAIALHDSKVLSATEQGGGVRVRLDAYLHLSSGAPGAISIEKVPAEASAD